jgi:hypothetical protein
LPLHVTVKFSTGNLYGPGSRKGDKQPPVKKKRIDTVGDWMSPDVFDLEVYGQDDAPTSQKITSYTFEVYLTLFLSSFQKIS